MPILDSLQGHSTQPDNSLHQYLNISTVGGYERVSFNLAIWTI